MDQGFQKCRNSCVSSFVFQWQSFYHDFFFIQDQVKANALKEKKKDYEKLLKKQNLKDEEPRFNEFSSALDRFKQKR